MTTMNKKSIMAEMLVRHVFGESETFERLCDQRGVSVEDAVGQALREWVGPGLSVVRDPTPLMNPTVGMLPDPADCPPGQEAHYIGLCEHDLNVLRQKQQLCFQSRDKAGLNKTNRTIEHYIQTLASLRERSVA